MTRKPAFWILLALVSAAAAVFSWQNFTRAFPLLSIDIRMDRPAALARARALAAERRLGPALSGVEGPADFRDAASFSLDEEVQTFVELEGGGKPAFSALVADPLFAPYRWRVRHFREREKHEVTFSVAPDGTPNGFVETLPEDAPGAALPAAAAREIAEKTAAGEWNVDLAPFHPVEQSQERRPSGRVDHAFVYERTDRQLGEGRLRLRLAVSGDRLTELTYFLKVPDAFTRRYEQMRSVNTAIGIAGSLAFLVVYGVGGIAFGLFVLARERWVLWRQPVVWGTLVALAQTAAAVNEWPLAWMQYDTALSTRAFVAQQAALMLAALGANVVVFSLSFMAAESLTRRAFPGHPQFWRIWSRDVAPSRAVLGRTVAGYLLVPLFIAYEVVLYFFATKTLGWWTPSEALFNPDILAAYAPWVSAIAKSFQAGFWEESLFRAVPIAGAALIGDRLGHRRLWIIAAFVVQAVIFGAGHAPYPTQPAYARPVELIVPSIAFGLLYLMFGLLPGIILHFTFDTFWFAMPLFATTAAGIHVQQVMVVLAALIPLWIVVYRRVQAGRFVELPAGTLNGAWRPEAPLVAEPARPMPRSPGLAATHVRWVLILGAVGAVVWLIVMMRLPIQHHSLRASRLDAARAARTALGPAHLGPAWHFLPVAEDARGPAHRFVWETAGRATYSSLLGTYLDLPGWTVFVRTFEGDVAERAETWTVDVDFAAVVQRISHQVPESRPGATLEDAVARQRARRALVERFMLDDGALQEVSAVPSKLPHRTDWIVTFADRSRSLSRGELRLSARLVGDEITDLRRFVFIPEDWERTRRDAQTIASIIQGGGVLIGAVLVIGGVIAAIVSWSRRQFGIRLFVVVFAAFVGLILIRLVNGLPEAMATLSTSQSLRLQLLVLAGTGVVGLGVQSAALAVIAGAVATWSAGPRIPPTLGIRLGVAIGAAAAAARAIGALLGTGPLWPSYAGASTFVPFLAAAINPVINLMTRIVFLTFVVAAADWMSARWTRRRVLVAALLVIVGGMLGSAAPPQDVARWMVSAALTGGLLAAVYIAVLRHDIRIVPLAAAVISIAGTMREGWSRAYPGALAGSIVAFALMGVVAYLWFRALAEARGR